MAKYTVRGKSLDKQSEVEADLFTVDEHWVVFYAGDGATQTLAKAAVGAFPTHEVVAVIRDDA